MKVRPEIVVETEKTIHDSIENPLWNRRTLNTIFSKQGFVANLFRAKHLQQIWGTNIPVSQDLQSWDTLIFRSEPLRFLQKSAHDCNVYLTVEQHGTSFLRNELRREPAPSTTPKADLGSEHPVSWDLYGLA